MNLNQTLLVWSFVLIRLHTCSGSRPASTWFCILNLYLLMKNCSRKYYYLPIKMLVFSYLYSSLFYALLNADTAIRLIHNINFSLKKLVTFKKDNFYFLRHATRNDGFRKKVTSKEAILHFGGVQLTPLNTAVGVQRNCWSLRTNYPYMQNEPSVSFYVF